jgi:hypothetical protein
MIVGAAAPTSSKSSFNARGETRFFAQADELTAARVSGSGSDNCVNQD